MKSQGLNIIRLLNDIGIQHRDALTRNIATFTNSPRKSIIFDFETAFISHQTLNEKQRQQDEELFLQSLFFQLLSQNQGNKELIEKAKKISSL
jgi:hypothetical protein